MNESTRKLVAALKATRQTPTMAGIIEDAENEMFHDYASPIPFPTIQLVKRLTKAGYYRLARRVKRGEFDATLDEGKAWANSEEGREVLSEFIGDNEND